MAILVFVFLTGCLLAFAAHCVFDIREFLVATRLRLSRCIHGLYPRIAVATQSSRREGTEPYQTITPLPTRGAYDLRELAVVVCHFNPLGWSSTRENYLRFLTEMRSSNVPVFNVEVAFEGQSFISSNPFLAIRATSDNILWQKERLFNYAVENLPAHFEAIALVDADIIFLNPSWRSQALSMLREATVVQLFDRMHRLDRRGALSSSFSGALQTRDFGENKKEILAPWIGGAWAVRRDVFPLYDRCILGGGDVANYEGWLGLSNTWLQRQMSPAELRFYLEWADSAVRRTGRMAGALTGDCIHMYHGQMQQRAYSSRHAITRMWRFDPELHLVIDHSGLLKWTEHCPPGLRTSVARYFSARLEDGVVAYD